MIFYLLLDTASVKAKTIKNIDRRYKISNCKKSRQVSQEPVGNEQQIWLGKDQIYCRNNMM